MDWLAPVLTGAAIGIAAAVFSPKNPPIEAASAGRKTKASSPSKSLSAAREEHNELERHARETVGGNPKLQKFFGVSADGNECDSPMLDADQLARRNIAQHPHLQKVLGVNENGEDADDLEFSAEDDMNCDSTLVCMASRVVSGLTVCLGVCYAANLASNGDFGRLILGLFPVEMEALHLKEYLLKFHTR